MSKRKELKIGEKYKNKSRIFLLPLLNLNIMHCNDDMNFLIDVNILDKVKQVVIIFENVDYEPLKEDIYRLSNSPYYLDVEYGDDNKEICMFFGIPNENIDDFEKFKIGAYSTFSISFKEKLIKEYSSVRAQGINDTNGLPSVSLYDVICPTLEIRQLLIKQLNAPELDVNLIKEVLDPPKLDKEEFRRIEEYGR
jgi:hypothetical protein